MIAAPPVYLDECVDCELAPRLVQRGFVVTTALAQGMVGISDEQQFRLTQGFQLAGYTASDVRQVLGQSP